VDVVRDVFGINIVFQGRKFRIPIFGPSNKTLSNY